MPWRRRARRANDGLFLGSSCQHSSISSYMDAGHFSGDGSRFPDSRRESKSDAGIAFMPAVR
jgi:hypothetical protein